MASSPAAARSRAAAACSRRCGRVEHLRGRPALDDAAAVHDDRLVGDLAHDREVVADEDVGDAGALADVGEQVEDLRLDRDVERGDGLVEDDHARLGRERAGDRDALALAARQRARQRARLALVEPDELAQLAHARARRSASSRLRCRRSTSSIACSARLARVEARVRVLEDDLHLAAAAAALARRARRHRAVAAAGGDRAGGRRGQPDEHPRDVVLPEPGLADDRQRAALGGTVRSTPSTATDVAVLLAQARRPRGPRSGTVPSTSSQLARAAPPRARSAPRRRRARASGGRASRQRSWARRSAGRTGSRPAPRTPTRAGPGSRPAGARSPSMSGRAAASAAVYGCSGSRSSSARRPRLDDLPGVHHRRAVAHRGGELEVVGDEQQRQPALAAQLVEDRHHLGLRGHVERRRRLVGEHAAAARRAARSAIITRCSRPPDSSCGYCSSRRSPSSMPTSRSASHRAAAAPRRAGTPCSAQRLGHEVADPRGPGSRARAGPGRSSRPARGSGAARRRAARARRRRRTGSRRSSARRAAAAGPTARAVIDLPEPDSPTRPTASPAPIVSETSCSTGRSSPSTGSRAPSASISSSALMRRCRALGRRRVDVDHGRARSSAAPTPEHGDVVVRAAGDLHARRARRCRRSPDGTASTGQPAHDVEHRREQARRSSLAARAPPTSSPWPT